MWSVRRRLSEPPARRMWSGRLLMADVAAFTSQPDLPALCPWFLTGSIIPRSGLAGAGATDLTKQVTPSDAPRMSTVMSCFPHFPPWQPTMGRRPGPMTGTSGTRAALRQLHGGGGARGSGGHGAGIWRRYRRQSRQRPAHKEATTIERGTNCRVRENACGKLRTTAASGSPDAPGERERQSPLNLA